MRGVVGTDVTMQQLFSDVITTDSAYVVCERLTVLFHPLLHHKVSDDDNPPIVTSLRAYESDSDVIDFVSDVVRSKDGGEKVWTLLTVRRWFIFNIYLVCI